MKARYNNIEVVGESKEQCISLVKEALGSFDATNNTIVLNEDIDESLIEYSYTSEEKKLNADYNGTSVSLTSKDALGLLQVKTAFELGVTKTNFKFQNGTVMEMTPEVFGTFAPWFAEKRNEFFI